MSVEILTALRAAADAKAAYWDRMVELEAALGCEDPIISINNHLVTYVDDLAVNMKEPGYVEWIDGSHVDKLVREVTALADAAECELKPGGGGHG